VLFQSGNVQLFVPSDAELHLDAGLIEDKQAAAGAEIHLPGQPDYGFIGRDADIWKLEKAFERETIVLLQAMAGVGKTTTAVGFARWWAETGALHGPIFFFSFESYTTLAHVCDRIGEVFRAVIKSQLGTEWHLLDAAHRRKLAVDILRKLPCLMIWDNFEPVAGFPKGSPTIWKKEEQQELKDFLQALSGGATRVIITSRRDEEWLGRCYQKITLRGLNQRDAMELAGKVLDRADIDRQKLKPYDKLLHYLQGNPLAIQVILPELAHSEPDELLVALQTGAAKLSKDDIEQGREHSLTASLEYRMDKLDKLLRSRLGVLGLFQGFVNANMLAFICHDDSAPGLLRGLDSDAWIQMLDLSAEIGLLRKVGHGLYNIHPALPWFFHQILQTTYANDMEWLDQRLVAVCGDLSQSLQQQLKANAETAMRYLRLEEQNFRFAIHLGCRYKMWDALNRILCGMAEMLGRQSRWSEFELLNLDVKREATDEQGAPLAGAQALCVTLWHNLGIIAQERREFNEAEQWYRKSLAIEEKFKDKYGQAQTLHQLGMIAQERREFNEAEQWYRKSLAIKEKLKDEYGQAQTLHQLGMIAQERREFNEAEQWCRKSLAIEEKLKDKYGQAQTLHQLGIIAQERREFNEAEQWYRKSLAIKEKLKDEYGQASTLHQLGIIAQKRRDFDEAERLYLRAEAIFENYRDEHSLSIVSDSLERLRRNRA
jgi:tetratricopeptide (TPR) repeat protein